MPVKSSIVQKYYKFLPLLFGGSLAVPVASLATPFPTLTQAPETKPIAIAKSREFSTHSTLLSLPTLQLQSQHLPPPPSQPTNSRPAPPPPPQLFNSPPSQPNSNQNRRYAVYVNGDTTLLLRIVQQIEPNATVQRYKQRRVILVGYFFDESSAQQRVAQLQSRGIQPLITNFEDREEFTALTPIQQPNSPPSFPNPPIQSPSYPGTSTGLYQVYVDAGSASLSQVRQVEPTAFVRQYRGRTVIQAGSFADEFNARRRVDALARRGIRASLVKGQDLSGYTPTQPASPPAQNLNNYYYFVVIPGQRSELASIATQVLQLGVPPANILSRDWPGDAHIAVGPFSDRQTATRWQQYLQDFGVRNARLAVSQ